MHQHQNSLQMLTAAIFRMVYIVITQFRHTSTKLLRRLRVHKRQHELFFQEEGH